MKSVMWKDCALDNYILNIANYDTVTPLPLIISPNFSFPSIDQILVELIHAGGERLFSHILHLLTVFGMRSYCFNSGRSLLLHIFTRIVLKGTVVITEAYHFYQQYKFLPIILSLLTPCIGEVTGYHQYGIHIINQLLIIFFAFARCLRKKMGVHQLFIDFKETYDLFRKEVLLIIFSGFGRLIKTCLNKTCSEVSISEHLFDKELFLLILLVLFLLLLSWWIRLSGLFPLRRNSEI